jgi:hypothetical protein
MLLTLKISAAPRCRSSELRRGKAKPFFKAQWAVAHEHLKNGFNAASPTRSRSVPNTQKKSLPKADTPGG